MERIETERKVNFFTLFVYFIALALFVVMRICGSYGLFAGLGPYGTYFLSLITQVGIIFLVPLTIFTIATKSKVRDVVKFCSFRKVSWKIILISFALGVLVFLLNNYVSSFFNSIIQYVGYKPSGAGVELPATWWTLLLNLLCTAVLPAFAEEILHRGLLLNGVSMMDMKKSILISGVLFGLFHLNIEQCFYAMIIGIFLGYLCYVNCSIYPCIIVHFMNNALSVFLSFAYLKNWLIVNVFGYVEMILSENVMLGVLISVLFFVLLLMLVGQIIKFMMKETFRQNFVKHQKDLTNKMIKENFYKDIDNIKSDKCTEFSGRNQGVFVIEFKDLFDFIEKNKAQIEAVENSELQDFKMDKRAKILLWGSFALSIIVTIMTFIWGILR